MKYTKIIFSAFALLFAAVQMHGDEVALQLDSNDMMQFDKKELRIPAGSTVTLTFTHSGKLPRQAMGHNYVLLKGGADVAAFAGQAVAASAGEYIPEGDAVIAHTKVIGGAKATLPLSQRLLLEPTTSLPSERYALRKKSA